MNITHRELVGKTVNLAEIIKLLQEIKVVLALKNFLKLRGYMQLIEYKITFKGKHMVCSTAASIFKGIIFFSSKYI